MHDETVDMIDAPPHYNNHPSGYEAIFFTRHLSFNRGNALKYMWRHRDKWNAVEDLGKAIWYAREVLNDMALGIDTVPDATQFLYGPDNLLHPLGHHIDDVVEFFETDAERIVFDKLMREDSPAWFVYVIGALELLKEEAIAREADGS